MITNTPEDNAIRREVVDPTRSFVVSAPAGSGKTGLLTLRVLELLCVVEKPEEILAITFTRKAAAEMHERVFHNLEKAAQLNDAELADLSDYEAHTLNLAKKALSRSKQRHWDLLSNPSRLNIATIDGFCRSICNQLPFFSAIGSSTSVIEDITSEYNLVTKRWLLDELSHADNAHILRLIEHFSGNIERLTALFSELLGLRDQWLPLVNIGADSNSLKHYFESTLSQWVAQSISRVRSYLAPFEGEIFTYITYANKHADYAKDPTLIKVLTHYEQFPEDEDCAVEFWRSLAAFFLTKNKGSYKYRQRFDKNMGFPSFSNKEENNRAKQTKSALISMLGDLEESGLHPERLAELFTLPKPVYEDRHWQVLEALIAVLPKMAAYLTLRFSELGQADFTEFSLGAARALDADMGDLDLLQRLDYRIHHILIDEFQDTSQTQLDLLKALTKEWVPGDGRTLFLVGDGMQSCYGFRNANVGIFLSMRHQGLENVDLLSRNLTVNFRSDKSLVDWVNEAFSPVFPEKDDINSGAVKYIPSTAFNETGEHSYVRCDAFSNGTNDEASAIAEEILGLICARPSESIAVLARSRNHLTDIIHAFEEHGIDYLATDFDALTSKQHIIDIHSLAQYLFDDGNKLAYLALLRSPMCALSHADLFQFFNFYDGENKKWSMQTLTQDVIASSSLSDTGTRRLSRLFNVLELTLEQLGRRSFSELVETAWLKLGAATGLSKQSETDDIQNYLSLLKRFEIANHIENWANVETALASEYATPASATDNPVQVMTMHKSKGLEFDTVFLPSLNKRRRADDSDILYWLEQLDEQLESHFILSPIIANKAEAMNEITNYIKTQKSEKSKLEDARIFYVACTRAKKRLYLSANFDLDEDGELKAPENSALIAKVWAKVAPELQRHDARLAHTSEATTLVSDPKLKALPLSWQLHMPDDAALASHRPAFDNSDFDFFADWDAQTHLRKIEGLVVHSALQLCARHGMRLLKENDLSLLDQFIHTRLRCEGLAEPELAACTQRLLALLVSLGSDEVLNWILSPSHTHSHSEWSLWSREFGEVKEHIIDRSFVEASTRWVLDYKTAQPAEAQAVNAFLADQASRHAKQLLRYRDLVADFDKHKHASGEITEIKVGLYFPMIGRFHHLQEFDLQY